MYTMRPFIFVHFYFCVTRSQQLSMRESLWTSNETKVQVTSDTTVQAASRGMCAAKCQNFGQCQSFAWDASSRACLLNPALTNDVSVSQTLEIYTIYSDLCDPSPCLNNGVCHSPHGHCDCTGTGFTGGTCSEEICDVNDLQGTASVVVTEQGPDFKHGYISTCDSWYMLSSDNSTVFCQDSVWSGATCNQRIFFNPALWVYHAIPTAVEVGWKACFQGYTTGAEKVSFFLLETSQASYAYFDFRINAGGHTNTTYFCTVHDSIWGGHQINPHPTFPFGTGVYFEISFLIKSVTSLEIQVDGTSNAGTTSAVYTFAYGRNLLDIRYTYFSQDMYITYMDLWCP